MGLESWLGGGKKKKAEIAAVRDEIAENQQYLGNVETLGKQHPTIEDKELNLQAVEDVLAKLKEKLAKLEGKKPEEQQEAA